MQAHSLTPGCSYQEVCWPEPCPPTLQPQVVDDMHAVETGAQAKPDLPVLPVTPATAKAPADTKLIDTAGASRTAHVLYHAVCMDCGASEVSEWHDE